MEFIQDIFYSISKWLGYACPISRHCTNNHSTNEQGETVHSLFRQGPAYFYIGTLTDEGQKKSGKGGYCDKHLLMAFEKYAPIHEEETYENEQMVYGTYEDPTRIFTGSFYPGSGGFKKGVFQGKPNYFYEGIVFNGEFKNGKMHKGVYTKNSKTFIGELQISKTRTNEDKIIIKEEFINGLLIEEISDYYSVSHYKDSKPVKVSFTEDQPPELDL